VGSTTRRHDTCLQRNGSWWNYEPVHKFCGICNSIPIRHNKECYVSSPFPRKLCAAKQTIKTHSRPTVCPELSWDRQEWITGILYIVFTQRQHLSKSMPEDCDTVQRGSWAPGCHKENSNPIFNAEAERRTNLPNYTASQCKNHNASLPTLFTRTSCFIPDVEGRAHFRSMTVPPPPPNRLNMARTILKHIRAPKFANLQSKC
jgi:hypothetical protein